MTARCVVFVGNCQVGMLANVYRRLVSAETGDEVEYVPAYESATDAQRRLVATADILVRQVLDFVPRIGDLETTAQVHLVPNVTAAFLWPYTGTPHPRNVPAPILDASGPYPAEIGDTFLNRMILQNVLPEEAVARYIGTDVAKVRNVDRLAELVLDRQRSRDQACGYDFADFIAANFRRQRLFRTPNHPGEQMAVKLASEVFSRIRVDDRILAGMQAQPPSDLFPATECPLHPGVIEHFGLDYASPRTRYVYFDEGAFTFEEYGIRYMNYIWNPMLPEGLYLAQQGKTEEAIRVLQAAIAISPRSATGRAVLSELLASRGSVRQAAEMAYQAVLLAPRNAHLQRRLDYLLTQYAA